MHNNSRTLKDNQPAYLADLLVRPKCSKYLRSTSSNRFVVHRIKTKTGSRAYLPIRTAETIFPYNSFVSFLLPVDELVLASIMTQDPAKDLRVPERYCVID